MCILWVSIIFLLSFFHPKTQSRHAQIQERVRVHGLRLSDPLFLVNESLPGKLKEVVSESPSKGACR